MIGPNAVLQTLRALERLEGPGTAEAFRARSGLSAEAARALIPEQLFVELIRDLRQALPEPVSEEVLGWGGALTARYVAAHRIPRPVRRLLAALPPRVALPLLLAAVRRHAWTFVGAGAFEVEGPYPGILVLRGAPTCRDRAQRQPHGAFYQAAFEGLLSLAAPQVRVRETACQSLGAAACRFTITA